LPVHLIVGLGEAARLAGSDRKARETRCVEIRAQLLECFEDLPHSVNGDPEQTIPSTLNISFHGVDAEAAIVCLKGIVAVSNGAACTSSTYSVSHVLEAMGLPEDRIRQSLRWSWSHMTPDPPMEEIRGALRPFLG
jgi:cysteine desulfurase